MAQMPHFLFQRGENRFRDVNPPTLGDRTELEQDPERLCARTEGEAAEKESSPPPQGTS